MVPLLAVWSLFFYIHYVLRNLMEFFELDMNGVYLQFVPLKFVPPRLRCVAY